MFKGKYEIMFTRHALVRADERGITADLVESTILTGRMVKFGKSRVKFVKNMRDRQITCVDEIRQNCIWIVSITARRKL